MSQDIPHLARLLRSFFNSTELREFLHTLEDGDELLARMPSQASSLVETCNEAASLIDRWGMTDAELLSKLMQRRPTRVQDLMCYCRLRASAPTTVTRRSTSIEMTASIEHLAVGIYRLHPGQVKTLGRSSEAEIQFPVELAKLSRLHAWTSWPSDGPQIQDLGSKNGTWVNGQRVSRAPLHHGDRVQLGEVSVAIQEPDRTETAVCFEGDTLS